MRCGYDAALLLLPPVSPPESRGPRGKSATRRTSLALRDAMTAAERAAASAVICDAANALLTERSSAEIELELPGEPPLHLTAEVVRVEEDLQSAGMGLRILVDGQDGRPLANFIMRQHAKRP